MSQASLTEGIEDLQMDSQGSDSQKTLRTAASKEDVVYISTDKLLFDMLKDVRHNRKKYWENEIRKHLNTPNGESYTFILRGTLYSRERTTCIIIIGWPVCYM